MPTLAGSTWTAVLVVVVLGGVAVALFVRYRALERAGTPLPPGAGGSRLVGSHGTVTRPHVPGVERGAVLVLGDQWDVADEVADQLRTGDEVRVIEVTGVRLVVARTVGGDDATGHGADHDTSGSH